MCDELIREVVGSSYGCSVLQNLHRPPGQGVYNNLMTLAGLTGV